MNSNQSAPLPQLLVNVERLRLLGFDKPFASESCAAKALITAGSEASLYPDVAIPLINYGLAIAKRVLQHAPETSNDLAMFASYGETAVSEMSRIPAQSQREPAMPAYSTTPFGVAVDFSPERIGPSGWLSASGVDDVIKVSKSSDGGESAMSDLAGALIDIGRGLLSSSSADIAEEMIEFGVMQCNPATAPDVLASKVFFGLLDLSAKHSKDERLSEAIKESQRAIEIVRRFLPSRSELLAAALKQHGEQLLSSERFAESASALRSSIQEYERLVNAGNKAMLPDKMSAHLSLSVACSKMDKVRDVWDNLSQAVQIGESLVQEDAEQYAPALAQAYMMFGKYMSIVAGDHGQLISAAQKLVGLYHELVKRNRQKHLPGMVQALVFHAEAMKEVLHYRGMHASADEAVKLTQELLARGESPNTLSLSGQALTMKVMALRWLAMSGEEEINEDSLRLCQKAIVTLERVRSADPAVWKMDCLESFLGYAINARDDMSRILSGTKTIRRSMSR